MKLRSVLLSLAALSLTLTGCATTETDTSAAAAAVPASKDLGPAPELRLGYFANVTHASAVYGVGAGTFQEALGAETALKTQVFNAGPAAVEALFGDAVDATFIGPNPAINGFIKSGGEALRIVSGATSGGAALVVAAGITSPAQLEGEVIASPQTLGTQDIALRTWLADNGFEVDEAGAGDVTVRAQENSLTLQEFQAGRIAGAWVPEPWASRLVLEGGGTVLVDEKTLWPQGEFVTTHLIVRTQYLRDHPQTIKKLLEGQVAAGKAIEADLAGAKTVVNAELLELTGKALQPATIDRAFAGIEVTTDPLAETLKVSAQHAFATGLTEEADLTGIYDLTLLREVLGTDVSDAGLGTPTRPSDQKKG